MKFAPFCLVLAVLSPAVALKGSRRQQRRLNETTVEEASESITFGDDVPFNFADRPPPTEPPTPAPAPTTEPAGETSEEVVVSEEIAAETDKNQNKDTALYETEDLTTEEGDVEEKHHYYDDDDDDDSYHYDKEKDDYKSTGSSGSSKGLVVDGECQAFCAKYLQTCETANAFTDPYYPRGAPARRRLIAGEFSYKMTRLGGSVLEATNECEEACAGYPRPYDPNDYLFRKAIGVNSIGDTFWCRKTHLDLAAAGDPFSIQVHCPAASPSGGGICSNVELMNPYNYKNATAWEFIRAGTDTARHLGYCQMYYNDYVADCTNAGIDDRTLSMALALIPTDTGIIILNNNVGKRDSSGQIVVDGITALPDDVFKNLMCPECIEAVIIDDGIITTVSESAFASLALVEQISLNMQQIMTLPAGLFSNNPFLREFTMYNTADEPGQLMAIPENLFRTNPLLERLVISGHRGLSSLPSCMFCNILANDASVLKILIMSNNGLTNSGVQAGMFNNLGELLIWDFSGNQFTTANAGWFSAGWAFHLKYIYLYNNPITYLDRNFFDQVEKLEVALLHDTDLISVPVSAFANNPYLISYTVSAKPS